MSDNGAGGRRNGGGGWGYPSLSPKALEAAQQAAERTGEVPAVFIARAIEMQAKRDKSSLKMGVNPITGDKLKGEA